MELRSTQFLNKRAAVMALFVADTSNGLNNAPGVDITVQGLFSMFFALACYAVDVITVIMVIMIVWYGYKMMSAGSSGTAFDSAKKSLTHAVVGILVVFAANTIIATVGNAVEQLGNASQPGSSTDLSQRSSNYINYSPLKSCSS